MNHNIVITLKCIYILPCLKSISNKSTIFRIPQNVHDLQADQEKQLKLAVAKIADRTKEGHAALQLAEKAKIDTLYSGADLTNKQFEQTFEYMTRCRAKLNVNANFQRSTCFCYIKIMYLYIYFQKLLDKMEKAEKMDVTTTNLTAFIGKISRVRESLPSSMDLSSNHQFYR